MRKILLLTFTLILSHFGYSQGNTWEKIGDWPGLKRTRAVAFAIGDYGYAGTGVDTAEKTHNDWWKYDPTIDTWTQVSDVPGSVRRNAVSFVIGENGYVGTGIDTNVSDFGIKQSDFYVYNPDANIWSPIASYPGGGGLGVYQATGFAVGNSGFVACGKIGPDNYLEELWEYQQSTNTWIARPPFPGGDRHQLSSFALENKGYVGMGTDHDLYRKDWWQYNPTTFSWTEVSSLPGTERSSATTFVLGSRAYVVFGSDGGVMKECWEYNPFSDSWNVKANYGGSARKYGVAFSIGDTAYAGLGQGFTGKKQSWYKYIPAGPLEIGEEEPFSMTVFPNPVTEASLVSLSHQTQSGFLTIHDLSGRMVFNTVFESNNISLSGTHLESGQYVLSIADRQANYLGSTKIFVQ